MNYEIEVNQQTGKKVSQKWLNKIVSQALGVVGIKKADISIAFVGDKEIRKLNKRWRGENRITDVLSFTYEEKPLVGEIIICYPQAVKQAKERGHRVMDEIKILLVHGLLHLCGYNHERGPKKTKEMILLQNKVLNKEL